ncbi:MAG: exodeoxyribonuclease VII small subunit [Deltaproteobacteria bacterium]|nr:exodeoxyribonuclease VII small subunit [Candidatus Tharpella aukensis]
MAKASFEDSMKRLEEVVGKLEGEEVSLEESLKLFEQGVKLMRFCHLRLSEVEEKVQILVADEKEGARLEEFRE